MTLQSLLVELHILTMQQVSQRNRYDDGGSRCALHISQIEYSEGIELTIATPKPAQ